MQTILVKKRFGNEELGVQEFIRPNTHMVAKLADSFWSRSRTLNDYIERCWRFVLNGIHTPTGDLLTRDWHAMYAFHDKGSSTPLAFYQANDFWAFPSETLTTKIGDCDDKSILLVSLLRRYNVWAYATVGTFQGAGHMWVVAGRRNKVLETTAPRPIEPEATPYVPMFRFNERQVIQLRRLENTPLVV